MTKTKKANKPGQCKLKQANKLQQDNYGRGIRGGGWYYIAQFTRVAFNSHMAPNGLDDRLGFRLSRVVSPLEQLTQSVTDDKS